MTRLTLAMALILMAGGAGAMETVCPPAAITCYDIYRNSTGPKNDPYALVGPEIEGTYVGPSAKCRDGFSLLEIPGSKFLVCAHDLEGVK